jgi:hypothetical protein
VIAEVTVKGGPSTIACSLAGGEMPSDPGQREKRARVTLESLTTPGVQRSRLITVRDPDAARRARV